LAGDVIVAVNDEATEGMMVEQVVQKIRGEVGTTVKLGVSRAGVAREFSPTRAEVSNPSVYSSVRDGVGILTITRFDGQTAGLARQAARSFSDQGVQRVILDLRGNGGGFLTAAQDVAGIWLDRKLVVIERANGRVVDELFSSSNPILDGVPTIVLVDNGTASASEIVAGALQEYKVAELVGEQTFGKGSVQQLIPLTAGAQLKVTIARWFTPQGKNISETGIVPTVKVERTIDDLNAGRDPQLDAALQRIVR
jgi:carboxyl-terminal processing protease